MELGRYDVELRKKDANDFLLVADSEVVKVRREGAFVSDAGPVAIAPTATVVVNVYDIGSLINGDTVQKNASNTEVLAVGAVTATTASLTNNTGSAISLSQMDRLVPTNNQPTLYREETGTLAFASTEVTTDALGAAYFYAEEDIVDLLIESVALGNQVIPSQRLNGGGFRVPLEKFCTLDGSTDDTVGLQAAIDYAQSRSARIVRVPPIENVNSYMKITGKITLNNVLLEGAYRQNCQIHSSITGDVAFEIQGTGGMRGLKLSKEAGGIAQYCIDVNSAATRPVIEDIEMVDGGMGIRAQALGTTIKDIWCTGDQWNQMLEIVGATAQLVSVDTFRAHHQKTGLPVAVLIRTSVKNAHLRNVIILPTGGGSGLGISIGEDVATNLCEDIKVSDSYFSGNTTAEAGKVLSADGVTLNNVTFADSLVGLEVGGASAQPKAFKGVGCSVYAIQERGVDFQSCLGAQLTGHMSSDVSIASAGTHPHVDIAVGALDVGTVEVFVGNYLRGGGASAHSGVRLQSGAIRPTAISVRGDTAFMANEFVHDAGAVGPRTGHNQTLNADTGVHDATAGAQATSAAGDATPTVADIDTLILPANIAYTITDFADGRDGQRLVVFNNSGNTVTMDHVATVGPILSVTGADVLLLDQNWMAFKRINGIWYTSGVLGDV